jgi:hypothetical protein
MVAKQEAAQPTASAPAQSMPSGHGRRRVRWAAYAWGAVILGSLLVATPLALGSIGRQLIAPPSNQVYLLLGDATYSGVRPAAGDTSYLGVTVTALDETKKTATFRVSGNRACTSNCPPFKVRFSALGNRSSQRAGLPPSAVISVAAGPRSSRNRWTCRSAVCRICTPSTSMS